VEDLEVVLSTVLLEVHELEGADHEDDEDEMGTHTDDELESVDEVCTSEEAEDLLLLEASTGASPSRPS
jgi:hypothetical protein